ncbi:MAG TPA: ATP-binding protein [Polyangia bacterium]|nr:ATP-binding protein [Polyangia bacterium]
MTNACPSEDAVPEAVDLTATSRVQVPRVLILDGDAGRWSEIVAAIRKRGLGAMVLAAEASAIEVATACDAQVIIVEVQPPVKDGLDLVARLRAALPDAEVIVTSDALGSDDIVAAFRAGVYDVVRRPFRVMELGPAILRGVNKRKAARAAAEVLREGQRLLMIRDRAKLFAAAVEYGRRALRADVVAFLLRDEAEGMVLTQAPGGTIDSAVARRILELRAPALTGDDRYFGEPVDESIPFGGVRSSIVCPLVVGDRVVGALNVGRSSADEPFASKDLGRAGVVASQIVLALEALRRWQSANVADRLAILGEVASSVIHEINNPLSAVIGHCDLALDSAETALAQLRSGAIDPEEVRAALVDIRSRVADARSAADVIQAVAGELRVAAQSENAGADHCDVASAIRGAVRLATAEVRRQTAIEESLEPGLIVGGGSGVLSQAFLGLVLSAHRRLRTAATRTPRITIVARRDGDDVRVEVGDNGPALPAGSGALDPSSFEAPPASAGAASLGLSIVREIVRMRGGRMEVSSSAGEGNTISVVLPTADVPTADFPPLSVV